MRPAHVFIGILACSLLASCAQSLGHGEIDWEHGARRGIVVGVLDPQHARVRYRSGRLRHEAVATVPAGMALLPGDEVELWPETGDGGMAHVERRLAAPADAGRDRL